MTQIQISKKLPISFKILTVENLIELITLVDFEYQKENQQAIPLLEENEKLEKKSQELRTIIELPFSKEVESSKNYKQLLEEWREVRQLISENEKVIRTHKVKLNFEITTKNETTSFNDIGNTSRMIRNEKILEFGITFFDYIEQKNLKIKLMHGQSCIGNYISISGGNEEWVRSTYDLMKNKIDTWKTQFKFTKYQPLIMLSLFAIPALLFYAVFVKAPFSGIFGWLILILLFGSIFIPPFIIGQMSDIFPCIELQTGAENLHFEKSKRNKIIGLVVSILIPTVIAVITILYPK
jgi:hypothetical protein